MIKLEELTWILQNHYLYVSDFKKSEHNRIYEGIAVNDQSHQEIQETYSNLLGESGIDEDCDKFRLDHILRSSGAYCQIIRPDPFIPELVIFRHKGNEVLTNVELYLDPKCILKVDQNGLIRVIILKIGHLVSAFPAIRDRDRISIEANLIIPFVHLGKYIEKKVRREPTE